MTEEMGKDVRGVLWVAEELRDMAAKARADLNCDVAIEQCMSQTFHGIDLTFERLISQCEQAVQLFNEANSQPQIPIEEYSVGDTVTLYGIN